MRRGLAGIEPTPARPNGAGYARLNLSATAGIITIMDITIMDIMCVIAVTYSFTQPPLTERPSCFAHAARAPAPPCPIRVGRPDL